MRGLYPFWQIALGLWSLSHPSSSSCSTPKSIFGTDCGHGHLFGRSHKFKIAHTLHTPGISRKPHHICPSSRQMESQVLKPLFMVRVIMVTGPEGGGVIIIVVFVVGWTWGESIWRIAILRLGPLEGSKREGWLAIVYFAVGVDGESMECAGGEWF